MLINARHADELRLAIIQDGNLEAYEVEAAESGMRRGNIYRGVVVKIEPSLNAAFIDYGADRHGFLPGDDVLPEAFHKKVDGSVRHPPIATVLERGKPVVVQVVKEGVGTKGAALTTNLSFAGRYLVLTPFDQTRGISRKVEDEAARKKLRQQVDSLDIPENFGVIARTNALDQNKTNLARDLNALLRLWKRLRVENEQGKGARLLYSDQDLVLQALRDYLDSSIDEVLVDDDQIFQKAEEYMRAFMPRARTQLTRYEERIPLFARFHLDQQIERIYERTVELPSGGSIVIDGTEALTAIDVNSGKTRGGATHEETVVHTNLEAAYEVARQLRLRDIGGLVVVDFIDMRQHRNHRKVEKALRDAMKVDRARVSLGRISDNGLLEINRQRIKQELQLRTHRDCPTCKGTGVIASPEFVALGLLRRIEARAAAGDLKAVRIALHPELADGIQNSRRQEIAALEREFDIHVEIIAATHLHRSEEVFEWKRRMLGKDEPEIAPRPVPAPLTASDVVSSDEADEAKPGEGRKRKRRDRRGKRRDGVEGRPSDARPPDARPSEPSPAETGQAEPRQAEPRQADPEADGEPELQAEPHQAEPRQAEQRSEDGDAGRPEETAEKRRRRRRGGRRRKKTGPLEVQADANGAAPRSAAPADGEAIREPVREPVRESGREAVRAPRPGVAGGEGSNGQRDAGSDDGPGRRRRSRRRRARTRRGPESPDYGPLPADEELDEALVALPRLAAEGPPAGRPARRSVFERPLLQRPLEKRDESEPPPPAVSAPAPPAAPQAPAPAAPAAEPAARTRAPRTRAPRATKAAEPAPEAPARPVAAEPVAEPVAAPAAKKPAVRKKAAAEPAPAEAAAEPAPSKRPAARRPTKAKAAAEGAGPAPAVAAPAPSEPYESLRPPEWPSHSGLRRG